MAEMATQKRVTVVFHPHGNTDQFEGEDMDFTVDEGGYLTVYDYALRETSKPISGAIFVCAPGCGPPSSFVKSD